MLIIGCAFGKARENNDRITLWDEWFRIKSGKLVLTAWPNLLAKKPYVCKDGEGGEPRVRI